MTCSCLSSLNSRLAPDGLKLSESVSALLIAPGVCECVVSLPLAQQGNNRKPKSGQPQSVQATYCPFCGDRYFKESNPS
jgi:hypothetical protein